MKKKIRNIFIIIIILCGLIIWLTDIYINCVTDVSIEEEMEMLMENEQLYTIQEHGALHLDNIGQGYVGIGFGSLDWGKYTDENGITRRGYIAGLDMWAAEDLSSDEPSSQWVGDVHVGQEIFFGGYKIRVLAIQNQGRLFRASYWISLATSPEETP